ncbi:MAG: Ribosome-associated heat shock protein implicated in the recycling of the 50S subunit (S4 paralog) [Olavius algarvensis Gamma 3 endosymbiont]|nr:MAG: Ribosome-associated heat shock protein implicated in the recycling of the 50S subunit (S4 paralog) [Olavius algarvensis Gamma 3 endosymbiont]
MSAGEAKVRLDKWLWAARFFKTRALAGAAVTGGKVHLAGHRIKPSRTVKIDDCFEIQRGFERFEIIVTDISARRGSAEQAQTLYRETDASVVKRAREAEKRKLAALARPRSEGRPDKKQRRQIHRFTGKS